MAIGDRGLTQVIAGNEWSTRQKSHAPPRNATNTTCQAAVLPGSHVEHETASVLRNHTKIDDIAKHAAVNKLTVITK